MQSRRVAAVSIIATCGLLITGCGSKGKASNDTATANGTLTVGAALPLTGQLAREGILTQEGYQLCEEKINAKGGIDVGGKKVKLNIKFQDDTSKPDVAAQLVDQFNDQGVSFILSSYGSAATEAQAAAVEKNGQVLLDSAGADDKIFEKGYKRTFAVLSPATEYTSSMVKAVAELANPKPKTVVFISADDGFSKTATQGGEATAKKLGLTVLPSQYVPNGTTDVSSALIAIKGQNPDVVFVSAHVVEGIAVVQQAKGLGVTPQAFGITVATPTPDFVKTLGAAANGVLGSSQWSPTTKGKDKFFGTAKDYAAAFQAKFNRAPDYHNAEATAACLTLALAIEKAGSTDTDKVRDAIAATDAETFFGKIKFTPEGKNLAKEMSVIQIQAGKVVTIWPKDSAEGKIIWPAVQ